MLWEMAETISRVEVLARRHLAGSGVAAQKFAVTGKAESSTALTVL
jgi:hypothetical protein